MKRKVKALESHQTKMSEEGIRFKFTTLIAQDYNSVMKSSFVNNCEDLLSENLVLVKCAAQNFNTDK